MIDVSGAHLTWLAVCACLVCSGIGGLLVVAGINLTAPTPGGIHVQAKTLRVFIWVCIFVYMVMASVAIPWVLLFFSQVSLA